MVLLQHLCDDILRAAYNWFYKSGRTKEVRCDKLCRDNNIHYDSVTQLTTAIESLINSRYIVTGGWDNNFIYGITAAGVNYVESTLLIANQNGSQTGSKGKGNRRYDAGYRAEEHYESLRDKKIDPCFDVERLAESFVKQIDSVAGEEQDNVCMMGIFGPWGRGKTYFFNKVREIIVKKEGPRYVVVPFSVWKYQETPAIWAYLYETIYKTGTTRGEKSWIYLKSILGKINIGIKPFLIITIIVTGIFLAIYFLLSIELNIAVVISAVLYVALYIGEFRSVSSAYRIIQKYAKRVSYQHYLGVQNEIERGLEAMLTTCYSDKKKLLLYIDDLDRCTTDKMVIVLECLRTILENDGIRKRLVVVCSVDAEKLKKAYKNRNSHVWEQDDADRLAMEQMEKIFISGLGLPEIDDSQKKEYISKLTGVELKSEGGANNDTSMTEAEDSSDDAEQKGGEDPNFYTRILSDWLGDFVVKEEAKDKGITPRKLRIMYYQLLFANNILASKGGKMTKDIADTIMRRSQRMKDTKEDKRQHVLADMVVGY